MEQKGEQDCWNEHCACKLFVKVSEESAHNKLFLVFEHPSLTISKSDLISTIVETRKKENADAENDFVILNYFDEEAERRFLWSMQNFHELLSNLYSPSAMLSFFTLNNLPLLAGKEIFFEGRALSFLPRLYLPQYLLAFKFSFGKESALVLCLSSKSNSKTLAFIVQANKIFEFTNLMSDTKIELFIRECISISIHRFKEFRPMIKEEYESWALILAFLQVENLRVPQQQELNNTLISSSNIMGRLHNSLYYSIFPALMMHEKQPFSLFADFGFNSIDVFCFSKNEEKENFISRFSFSFSEFQVEQRRGLWTFQGKSWMDYYPIIFCLDYEFFSMDLSPNFKKLHYFDSGTAFIKKCMQAILDMMRMYAGFTYELSGFESEHEEEIAICFRANSQTTVAFILNSRVTTMIQGFPNSLAVFETEVCIDQMKYFANFNLTKTECSFSISDSTEYAPISEISRIPEFFSRSSIGKNQTFQQIFDNATLREVRNVYFNLAQIISLEHLKLSPIKQWIIMQEVKNQPLVSEKITLNMKIVHLLRIIRCQLRNVAFEVTQANENFIIIGTGKKEMSLLQVGPFASSIFDPLPKFMVYSRFFHFSDEETSNSFPLHNTSVSDFLEWFHRGIVESNLFEDLIYEIIQCKHEGKETRQFSTLTAKINKLMPQLKAMQSYRFFYTMLLALVNDLKFGYFPFEGKGMKIFSVINDKLFEVSHPTLTFYVIVGEFEMDIALMSLGIPIFAQNKIHYYDESGRPLSLELTDFSAERITGQIPPKSSIASVMRKFGIYLESKKWKDMAQLFASLNALQLHFLRLDEKYQRLGRLKYPEFLALVSELNGETRRDVIFMFVNQNESKAFDNPIELIEALEELSLITLNNPLGLFDGVQVSVEHSFDEFLAPSNVRIFRVFNSIWILNPCYAAKYLSYNFDFGIWFNSPQGERLLEQSAIQIREIITPKLKNETFSSLTGELKHALLHDLNSLESLNDKINFLAERVFTTQPSILQIAHLMTTPIDEKRDFAVILKDFLLNSPRNQIQIHSNCLNESWYSITQSLNGDAFRTILVNTCPLEIFILKESNRFEKRKILKNSSFVKVLLALLSESKPLPFEMNFDWMQEVNKTLNEGYQIPACGIWIPFMEERIDDFFLRAFKAQFTRLEAQILDDFPLHSGYRSSIIFALKQHPIQFKVHQNSIPLLLALINGMEIDENLILHTRAKKRELCFTLPQHAGANNVQEYTFPILIEKKSKYFQMPKDCVRMSILQNHTICSAIVYLKGVLQEKFYDKWTNALCKATDVDYFFQNPKLLQFMIKNIQSPQIIEKLKQLSPEVLNYIYDQIKSTSLSSPCKALELCNIFVTSFPNVKQVKAGNGYLAIQLLGNTDEAIIGYNSHAPINIQIPKDTIKLDNIMQLIFWQESDEFLSPKEQFIARNMQESHVAQFIGALDDQRKGKIIKFLTENPQIPFTTANQWNSFGALMNNVQWKGFLWTSHNDSDSNFLRVTLSTLKAPSVQLSMNTKGKFLTFTQATEFFIQKNSETKKPQAKAIPDANYQQMFNQFF